MARPLSDEFVDARDTLFRPTTLSSIESSAAPVREHGTRSRAGNAMTRTRSALMDGAARVVAASGTRITMSQVAAASGVAKATLYNHLRTREAVLAALVEHEVRRIAEAQAGKPLDAALADAASLISTSAVRAGLAHVEPAALADLARIDDAAVGWSIARSAVEGAPAAHQVSGTDTVLRWLASFLVSPATREVIEADVSVLLGGLPAREPMPVPVD